MSHGKFQFAEDIGGISHAHPTYSESFKDACLAASTNPGRLIFKVSF